MGTRPCCRSCRHCLPPSGADLGWCQLRQLPIHPELIAELSCHHWMGRLPRLPVLNPGGPGARAMAGGGDRQLSLAAVLAES